MAGNVVTFVIYVGTYTDKGVPSDGLYSYQLDFTTDFNSFTYSKLESVKINSPSFLVIAHNQRFLFAVSEASQASEAQIHSYEILADKKLKHVNSLPALGTYSCYVSIDSQDQFAYVANYFGGVASAFGINPTNGKLEYKNHIKFNESQNRQPRQEDSHVHMISPSLDNRHVYMTDLGNDVIYKLDHDDQKGFNETSVKKFKVPDGSGPRHFTIHPNGKFLYLSAELTNMVHVYCIDKDGNLEHKQRLSSLPENYEEPNLIAEIRLSPDNKKLYVSNRGHESIALFNVEDEGVKLSLEKFIPTGGHHPRNFDLNEKILIVANQNSNQLNVFKILAENNDLESIGDPIPCPQPVRVKIF